MKRRGDVLVDAKNQKSCAIRSAATIILWRQSDQGPEVLMGQRGSTAAFMPSKYVFPGGAVDPTDAAFAAPMLLSPLCLDRLAQHCGPDAPSPLTILGTALRELREETGLYLRSPAPQALRFMFRAITPAGAPRRFDARFFLVDAAWLAVDGDDLSRTDNELSHLHWIGLNQARQLDLPFITEVVLAEVTTALAGAADEGVPFFDNSGPTSIFRRLT